MPPLFPAILRDLPGAWQLTPLHLRPGLPRNILGVVPAGSSPSAPIKKPGALPSGPFLGQQPLTHQAGQWLPGM